MDVEPGQLVKSLVGRDKGKHYLIIGFEGERVLLADGRGRSIGQPKKKNPKHLQPYRCVLHEAKERIRQGKINDTEVRNILNTFLTSDGNSRPLLPPDSSEGGS